VRLVSLAQLSKTNVMAVLMRDIGAVQLMLALTNDAPRITK
jgi:hypothetical protein